MDMAALERELLGADIVVAKTHISSFPPLLLPTAPPKRVALSSLLRGFLTNPFPH